MPMSKISRLISFVKPRIMGCIVYCFEGLIGSHVFEAFFIQKTLHFYPANATCTHMLFQHDVFIGSCTRFQPEGGENVWAYAGPDG